MTGAPTSCTKCHANIEHSEDPRCPNCRCERRTPDLNAKSPRWWAPLVIPTVFTALCELSMIADYRSGRSNIDSEGICDLLAGLLFIWPLFAAIFVAPGFWSGVLYQRQRNQQPADDAAPRPRALMPLPPADAAAQKISSRTRPRDRGGIA